MIQNLILGVDIGGSHVTAAIIDLEANVILPHTMVRIDLDSKGDLDSILTVWTSAIQQAASLIAQKPSYLGISMPGPLDYEKGICMIKGQDKYDALFGLNIKQLLADRLQMKMENIRFINDAVAFLSGEILGGAAKCGKNVIGLTLGTGLGSAVSLNGTAVRDADLWKMPFKDGIAEEYLSTRWFVHRFLEKTGKSIKNVKELHTMAAANDVDALAIFKEFGANLGLFLQAFITQQGEIDTVVLGGNIAKTAHLFTAEIHSTLNAKTEVSIKQAMLGEDAALVGAAGSWTKADAMELIVGND